jgi:hypothetical protein
MNVNSNLILWIHSFLTNRLQYVNFGGTLSNVIEINTGAPQGCVLSAVLFIIYTSDCRSSSKHVIVKYADDTVIIGLISTEDDNSSYVNEINNFVEWCDTNFLNLNVSKTKEMVINFSRTPEDITPIQIKRSNVEIVSQYKYLGNIIDDKLKGYDNISKIYKKCNQRMYFLRKLKNVHIDPTILTMFYKSIIQSVLTFCISSWYGHCTTTHKKQLEKIVKSAKRVGCININDLDDLYEQAIQAKSLKIMSNMHHPLYKYFTKLPSGIRLKTTLAKTNRFKNSFVPKSIKLYNLRIQSKVTY